MRALWALLQLSYKDPYVLLREGFPPEERQEVVRAGGTVQRVVIRRTPGHECRCGEEWR